MSELSSVADSVIKKPVKPYLKAVNCIYIPVVEPLKAADWYEQVLGLNRVWPDGEIMLLGNGIWMFLCGCDGQTSNFVGRDHFVLSPFTFETEDIYAFHQSLTDHGAYVEPIEDHGGCGLKFWFKDPDGNRFHVWEDQTMIWLLVEGPKAGSPNLDRFAVGNPETDVHAYLKKVAEGVPGVPRRIQFAGPSIIREKDPQGLEEILGILEQFNREYPEKALTITFQKE